ncbi:hypothetical protein [Poseidonibacter ostreae]|uniref:Uncharacterized protein n=1 Tax=Poseidonibacter ostreae TaxID=2654171 RepID=A0A6L4WTY9_9BACT|nr:hypothetical protein [Poseidonibacter ostreae]KAB7888877.1 hypothetical protein GBG18_12235 [Poseidonibacter ostreae]KAB7889632.1 hypothetical protein GBG19_05335 [Poseidonibacter ostreae]
MIGIDNYDAIEQIFVQETSQHEQNIYALYLSDYRNEDVYYLNYDVIFGSKFKNKIIKSGINEVDFFNSLNNEINALSEDQRMVLCKKVKEHEDKMYHTEVPEINTLRPFVKWECE